MLGLSDFDIRADAISFGYDRAESWSSQVHSFRISYLGSLRRKARDTTHLGTNVCRDGVLHLAATERK